LRYNPGMVKTLDFLLKLSYVLGFFTVLWWAHPAIAVIGFVAIVAAVVFPMHHQL